MTEPRLPNIRSLTGLRGWAALWILLFHIWQGRGSPSLELFGIPMMPILNGAISVDVFFTLSGFVVFLPCAYALQHGYTIQWRNFYIKRITRLFPAYHIQLLVLAALFQMGLYYRQVDTWIAVKHLFLVQNIPPLESISIMGVYWTLCVEMNFYLSIPLILFFIRKYGITRVFIACLILPALFRYGATIYYQGGHFPTRWLTVTQLPGKYDQFIFGIAASMLYVKFHTHPLVSKLRQREPWLMALACGAILGCAALHKLLGHAYYNGPHSIYASIFWFQPLLSAVIAFLLLVLCLEGPVGNRLLANRFSLFIGNVSFGIYLWHIIVIIYLFRYFPVLEVAPIGLAVLPPAAIAILIATLSYKAVELPLIRRAKHLGLFHTNVK